jgi:hypothetical protein
LHFLDLRIISYGFLKFQGEVWVGRACAAANEKELTTCAKSTGQEEKNEKKNGNSPIGLGVDPWPAGDCWSPAGPGLATSGCPPAAGRHLRMSGCPNFFQIFLFKKN